MLCQHNVSGHVWLVAEVAVEVLIIVEEVLSDDFNVRVAEKSHELEHQVVFLRRVPESVGTLNTH